MADARSKLDLLYQDALGDVAEIVTRVEALQKGLPEATAALQDASAAAGSVKNAVEQIPEVILRQTAASGSDLKSQVETAAVAMIDKAHDRAETLQKQLEAAIAKAAGAGSAELRKAVEGLGVEAGKKRDDLVQEMQAAAARAAEIQIRAGLADRMARSWGVVAASLLLAMTMGAGGALLLARMTGHLTPWGDRIAVNSAGVPQCGGTIGKYRVCLLEP